MQDRYDLKVGDIARKNPTEELVKITRLVIHPPISFGQHPRLVATGRRLTKKLKPTKKEGYVSGAAKDFSVIN